MISMLVITMTAVAQMRPHSIHRMHGQPQEMTQDEYFCGMRTKRFSMKFHKDIKNPREFSGEMSMMAAKMKTGALVCALVSGGVWTLDNDDYHGAVVGWSIAAGAAAVITYAVGLRYEFLAGKYLKMSASPAGLTASINF